ncbi:hypothetical protein EAI_03004 [Harpegnathos saltator]|uniref:Uncharacterized protein n=1 Tax=Harpegnathos saltator TaxID=610380 RepID=E2BTL8_HARSA|nr:hypothetical protein EAI_03004 [Harpegnathos saltator]
MTAPRESDGTGSSTGVRVGRRDGVSGVGMLQEKEECTLNIDSNSGPRGYYPMLQSSKAPGPPSPVAIRGQVKVLTLDIMTSREEK